MRQETTDKEFENIVKDVMSFVRLLDDSLQRGYREYIETRKFKEKKGHKTDWHPWLISDLIRASAKQSLIDQMGFESKIEVRNLDEGFDLVTESGNAVEKLAMGGISVVFKQGEKSFHIKCSSLERNIKNTTKPMLKRIPTGGSKRKSQFAKGENMIEIPGFGDETPPDYTNLVLAWDRNTDGSISHNFLLAQMHSWGSKKSEIKVNNWANLSVQVQEVKYNLKPRSIEDESFG